MDWFVFLKRILLTGSGVSKLSKPAARIIQQAFFNEDLYLDRADYLEIMILGLVTRCDTIQGHLKFSFEDDLHLRE